jgi:rare lipoprotein A
MGRKLFVVFRHNLRADITLTVVLVSVLFLYGCAGHASGGPAAGPANHKETGIASFYAGKFQNRTTASGECFSNNSLTAAHRTLPFGTEVIVENIDTGKSVKVRINDRGPFVKGRIIDLTRAAFSQIADLDSGVVKVEVRVVK